MAKVLFDLSILATEARVRGIGRYVSELALGLEHLADEFLDVPVEFIEHVGFTGQARVSRGASAIVEQWTSSRAFEPHKLWAYRWRMGIARAVRGAAAGLLHQGHPNVTPLGHLNALRLVTCHDLIPLTYPERYTSLADGYSRGRRWLDQRRFGSADHILAISQATANALEAKLGIGPHKISVVHNGIDPKRWREGAETEPPGRSRAGGSGLYFLYVGDGDWRKNHERLFRALNLARTRLPNLDLRLLWAGKLSPKRQQLALEQAHRAGVAHALTLLGYVADAELRGLYEGAVATVFVSLAEGFGLPVLEAMAMGCAVITSNCSSLAEIGEGAALLVDPKNVDAIADALCRLAEDRTLVKELAEKGLSRSRLFSLERQARETYAVYRRCLGRQRSRVGAL